MKEHSALRESHDHHHIRPGRSAQRARVHDRGDAEQSADRDPQALYLIVGKTHPELVRHDGEAYRNQLWQLVKERGLEQHVDFVDEYLTQAQIVDYLLASDVYVTPYLDPKQITSGTLAYALGAGKAIVSTPYPHAVEVLAASAGFWCPSAVRVTWPTPRCAFWRTQPRSEVSSGTPTPMDGRLPGRALANACWLSVLRSQRHRRRAPRVRFRAAVGA